MTNSKNLVVILAFGIFGFCFGKHLEQCQYGEYETGASMTKICENEKSEKYTEIESKVMDRFLEDNKDWLDFEANDGSIDVDMTKVVNPIYNPKENCYSVALKRVPYVVEVEKKTYYIVQSEKFYFIQKLNYVKCKNQEADCFTNIFGYNTETSSIRKSCMEKTATVSLYAYDDDKKDIVRKQFHIPVACTCLMKRMF